MDRAPQRLFRSLALAAGSVVALVVVLAGALLAVLLTVVTVRAGGSD